MTRLIDADKLMQMIPTEEYNARMAIAYAPTVDAVEVKHGRWIIYTVSPWDGEDVKCSVCGEKGCAPYWDYCPHCGSQMVDVVSENEL